MILIIYTLKWSETIFERAINLKTFLQLGISMNETFKYFVKMQVHKNDIAKGQIKAKSRLARRRFSQKTNRRI